MKPHPFTPAQLATLLALRTALPGVQTVLVGAGALGCHMEMRWRSTKDLDLSVLLDPVVLAKDLTGLRWKPDQRREQRWTSAQGVVVDVLPTTPSDLANGKLTFAKSGHVMSLVGFDLALAHHVPVNLDASTTLDVATVPVIAVLKMAAWLDRPAERDRDLEDLAHVIDDYLEPDDLRRWKDDLINSGLDYENQSAFALGQDVAAIAKSAHVAVIEAFLGAVDDEALPANARLARCFGGGDSVRVLTSRLQSFRMGLQRTP